MGAYTVARDDFTNARRSYVVLGVIGVLAALIALVFASEINIYDDAYRTLYDVSALVAYVYPLFIAPLTYLAIAGDRGRGTIKYVLGLPNSRAEYFFAKYVSRASVAVGAVLLGTAVGFVIAAATFENGADPMRFLKFGAVSGLYGLALTGAFITLSSTTGSRSRAMFAVIGAYFVFVPFWSGFLPVISLQTILDFVSSTLGLTLSDATKNLIGVISPTNAYFALTEVVYTGVLDNPEYAQAFAVYEQGADDTLASKHWFQTLVLLGWATVVPALGYLKFRVSELG